MVQHLLWDPMIGLVTTQTRQLPSWIDKLGERVEKRSQVSEDLVDLTNKTYILTKSSFEYKF